MMVDKVVGALSHSSSKDQNMDDIASDSQEEYDNSDSCMEPTNDMVLL